MEATASRERNRAMDVVKAIAILSVVLAHAAPPGIVVEVVQIYYIAAFFFVSGYFFRTEYFTDLSLLIRRRVLPLYAVFVAWNFAFLVFEIGVLAPALRALGVDAGFDHQLAYVPRAAASILGLSGVYSLAGALWFVISLITATVLFGLIGYVAYRLPSWATWTFVRLAVLGCFLLGFGPDTFLRWPSHTDTALVGLVVLYAGYRYRNHERWVPLVPVAAALATAEVYLLRGQVDMTIDTYRGLLVFVVAVGSGIYALLYASNRLQRVSLLAYIGQNSLFIAATHILAFKLVTLGRVIVLDLPVQQLVSFPVASGRTWWVAYFLVGIGVPVAVKRVLDPVLEARKRRRHPPEVVPAT